jgi:transposase-like protein
MRKRPLLGGPWGFDESFKRMAVELSEANGSVSTAAAELGLDAGRICKWRASFNKPDFREKVDGLTEVQKPIGQLERELREVKLEPEIFKKAAAVVRYASFQGERNVSDS